MKQQMSREQLERRVAVLEAQKLVLERAARRNLELAERLSELHLKSVSRQLRGGK